MRDARHYGALGGAVAGCQERSSVVGFALGGARNVFGCVTAAHFLIGLWAGWSRYTRVADP